jgi:general secretion pathway protein D
VNLIGGMMEHDDVQNMAGLPWLSQIPILKYLFGQGQKSKTDNETVFALMPHVVRRLDVDEFNLRSVDMGTQNVVEVRHTSRAPAPAVPTAAVPSGVPTAVASAAPVAPAVPATPAVPAAANSGAGQNQQTAPPQVAVNAAMASTVVPAESAMAAASAAPAPARLGPVLSIDPPMVNQPTGGTFALNVILNGGQNVFSVPVQITYDSRLMQFVNVSNAGALSRDGAAVALVHRADEKKGTLQVSLMRPPGSSGIAPSGPLFTLMFVAKAAGQGTISVGKTILRDPNMTGTDASGSQAIINVR